MKNLKIKKKIGNLKISRIKGWSRGEGVRLVEEN